MPAESEDGADGRSFGTAGRCPLRGVSGISGGVAGAPTCGAGRAAGTFIAGRGEGGGFVAVRVFRSCLRDGGVRPGRAGRGGRRLRCGGIVFRSCGAGACGRDIAGRGGRASSGDARLPRYEFLPRYAGRHADCRSEGECVNPERRVR